MSIVRKLVYQAFMALAAGEMDALDKDCRDPQKAQLRKLKQILSANQNTLFGKEHNFKLLKTSKDYASAIPVSDYEAHRPYINKLWQGEKEVLSAETPQMFATTSGTMSEPKYIPVTASYIKEFRHASIASGYFTFKNYPKLDNGCTLSVFSPACEGISPGGIPYGAISGQLYLHEPGLVKRYISPIPYPVYLIKDYESKYYTLLRCALVLPLSSIYTLNPSTIVMLLKRLETYGERLVKDIRDGIYSPPSPQGKELEDSIAHLLAANPNKASELQKLLDKGEFRPELIWPLLQVVCCWTKASAAFYVKDFPQYFGNIPICDISYGASEGRGSISMGDGRQLLSIRSHYFEFIAEEDIDKKDAPVLGAWELSLGKNYYILFSTSAGLYRYHINDVIKVVGFHHACPLIEFQYKGGNVSSFTGEKLTELQVTESMRKALTKEKLSCRFFTVLPEFRPQPHYHLLFEAEADSEPNEAQMQALLVAFENELALQNIEYKVKRDSLRLESPRLSMLRQGSYESLRKSLSLQGVADAQIKLSHLNPKSEIRAYFEKQLCQDEAKLG